MDKYIFRLITTILFLLNFTSFIAQCTNLIVNGDFSSASTGSGASVSLQGWSFSNAGSCDYTTNSGSTSTSSAQLVIYNDHNGNTTYSSTAEFFLISNNINLAAGKSYNFSVDMAQTQDVTPLGVAIEWALVDTSTNTIVKSFLQRKTSSVPNAGTAASGGYFGWTALPITTNTSSPFTGLTSFTGNVTISVTSSSYALAMRFITFDSSGNITNCNSSNDDIVIDNVSLIDSAPLVDSDSDGVPDCSDLDDDNDGILDTTEGQCINTSNPSTDGFDSPLVATVNGNNIQSVNPYNGWGAETGGANAFNVIRVNGAGYSSGPDVAQSGTQYIDINSSSTYVYKNITLTTPTIVSASAWFANREPSFSTYTPWSTKIEIRNETTGITVAQGNTINFTSSISDEIWYNSSINSVALPAGTYRIRMFVGNSGHLDSISYCFSTDTDGDGTPDYLDTDSDGDECPDAVEGDENVIDSQLNANGSINYTTFGGLGATSGINLGVPNIVNTGGAADIGGDVGQGVGSAYNSSISSCFCYKAAQTTGTTLDTNHGITALGRAGADNSNWPMVRKGAWTVLEAKTKGFVVNRLRDDQVSAIPSADLREGMMVYNITQDCLQINIDGTATGWKCFNTQTCPD